MRIDLSPTADGPATISGPDGLTYTRRSTRMTRRQVDQLVAAGRPVVFDCYGHGRLEWLDGEDARTEWTRERAHLVTSEPTRKQLALHVCWTAGTWEAGTGEQIVYATGHC